MNDLSRPTSVDLVVDSSALLSIFLGEDTAAEMADLLLGSSGAVVCAPILLESSMVALGRGGHEGLAALDEIVASGGIVTIPADQHLVGLARMAFERFGTGRHPAGLNFGDCFSYALARHFDVPLLCTGDDFARTDLVVVPGRAA